MQSKNSKIISNNLSILNNTKGKAKNTNIALPFVVIENIKNKVLGKGYELSIAFVGTYLAKKINIQSRNKTYTPNTLSFPYEKNSGEIILCPIVIKKQAKQNKSKYADYMAYIIIHSMLHLKGLDHGTKMEKLETKFLKEFGYTL